MQRLRFSHINVLSDGDTHLESSFGWYSQKEGVMFQHLLLLVNS